MSHLRTRNAGLRLGVELGHHECLQISASSRRRLAIEGASATMTSSLGTRIDADFCDWPVALEGEEADANLIEHFNDIHTFGRDVGSADFNR